MAKGTPSTPWFGVPSNRQEALRIGHPHYFTGKPCIHGHLSNRDAKDRKCLQCERAFRRAKAKTPEYKAQSLAWCRANKDKRKASSEKSKIKHHDKVLNRMRDYYAKNIEKNRVQCAKWRSENKARILAANAARRAYLLQATPPWASLYRAEFDAIYAERQRLSELTGIEHHVDHIYPLKGKTSCGLHVPWNLRIVTKSENLRKRNKVPDEGITKSLTENGSPFRGEGLRSNVAPAL